MQLQITETNINEIISRFDITIEQSNDPEEPMWSAIAADVGYWGYADTKIEAVKLAINYDRNTILNDFY